MTRARWDVVEGQSAADAKEIQRLGARERSVEEPLGRAQDPNEAQADVLSR